VHQKNIIGVRIKTARKESHVSQMELAAKLQVLGIMIDRSAIAKVETGRRPITDIEIAAISRILNVQIEWLFAEREDWFKQFAQQQPDFMDGKS
jgi:transcriptional regulator with XRE-family HTH domain